MLEATASGLSPDRLNVLNLAELNFNLDNICRKYVNGIKQNSSATP